MPPSGSPRAANPAQGPAGGDGPSGRPRPHRLPSAIGSPIGSRFNVHTRPFVASPDPRTEDLRVGVEKGHQGVAFLVGLIEPGECLAVPSQPRGQASDRRGRDTGCPPSSDHLLEDPEGPFRVALLQPASSEVALGPAWRDNQPLSSLERPGRPVKEQEVLGLDVILDHHVPVGGTQGIRPATGAACASAPEARHCPSDSVRHVSRSHGHVRKMPTASRCRPVVRSRGCRCAGVRRDCGAADRHLGIGQGTRAGRAPGHRRARRVPGAG